MLCRSHSHLVTTALAALLCSSCVVKDGSLDFTWWKDAAAPVMEDDVVIESGGGYYRSTPAPERVPLASIPREEPEPPKYTPPAPAEPARPAETASATRAAEQFTPGVYVVQPGDTLTRIARRYRTTVSALVTANGMPGAEAPLRVNQSLRIPAGSAAPVAAAPAPPRKASAAPEPPRVPAASGGTYTVKAGDTLYRISRQYGVSPTALMQANGLTPTTANTIRVGATLRIPSAN